MFEGGWILSAIEKQIYLKQRLSGAGCQIKRLSSLSHLEKGVNARSNWLRVKCRSTYYKELSTMTHNGKVLLAWFISENAVQLLNNFSESAYW